MAWEFDPTLTIFSLKRARDAGLSNSVLLKTTLLAQTIAPRPPGSRGINAVAFLITDKLLQREAEKLEAAKPAPDPKDPGEPGDPNGPEKPERPPRGEEADPGVIIEALKKAMGDSANGDAKQRQARAKAAKKATKKTAPGSGG